MKLIIDMSDEEYDFTKGAKTARTYNAEHYVNLILNGTPLPDNATNGDIFTSVYKPYKVQEYTFCVSLYRTESDFKKGIEWLEFTKWWWNAPYKRGENK